MPLVKRTRATLRSAEFGFFGVCVNTRTHTPRFCGLSCSAGLFVLVTTLSRPLRTSWLIVGTILDNSSHARPGHETKTATTPTAARSIFRRARNRLNVPGLGSRITARHLELTYPIRLLVLRPQGHRRYREPNGFWRFGSRSQAPDRVSRSRPEPCKDSRKPTNGASLRRHRCQLPTPKRAQLPRGGPRTSGLKIAATFTPQSPWELDVGFFGSCQR